jgi:hypothetical protein
MLPWRRGQTNTAVWTPHNRGCANSAITLTIFSKRHAQLCCQYIHQTLPWRSNALRYWGSDAKRCGMLAYKGQVTCTHMYSPAEMDANTVIVSSCCGVKCHTFNFLRVIRSINLSNNRVCKTPCSNIIVFTRHCLVGQGKDVCSYETGDAHGFGRRPFRTRLLIFDDC